MFLPVCQRLPLPAFFIARPEHYHYAEWKLARFARHGLFAHFSTGWGSHSVSSYVFFFSMQFIALDNSLPPVVTEGGNNNFSLVVVILGPIIVDYCCITYGVFFFFFWLVDCPCCGPDITVRAALFSFAFFKFLFLWGGGGGVF